MRVFLGSKAAIAATVISYLQENFTMFTQYPDALALMSGFTAHNHSFRHENTKKILWHLG